MHAKEQGFTLIEAIVATFIFVIALGSIINVYMSTVRITRRADVLRTATENARFISEFVSKEVRNGSLVLDPDLPTSPCTGAPAALSHSLGIVNVDGDHECFYWGNNDTSLCAISCTSTGNLFLVKNSLSPVKLNGTNVSVPAFNVYMNPTVNPYCNNPPSCTQQGVSKQPTVTISGKIQISSSSVSNPKAQDNIIMPIETSISIPRYDFK